MTYFSIDVESDGQIPGHDQYSMIQLGICRVDNPDVGICLNIKPISDKWDPEALSISGFTREETLAFPYTATQAMVRLENFIKDNIKNDQNDRPIFIADNNGYDWSFVNWYFHAFLGRNPFGWSSRNLNDVFHGIKLDMRASFRHLRPTAHTHNALDDARANAGAMLAMIDKYGLKAKL